MQVTAGMKEVRDRIGSVKNTQKITEAMKLVAAAKVRRAQDAVINSRPFTENLVKVRSHPWDVCQVLYGVNQRVRVEDVDSPLCEIRPVQTVQLVCMTGDRGLCGGYNNFILKKVRDRLVCITWVDIILAGAFGHPILHAHHYTEQRFAELTALGLKVQVVAVGKKAQTYFKRRPKFNVISKCSAAALTFRNVSQEGEQGLLGHVLRSTYLSLPMHVVIPCPPNARNVDAPSDCNKPPAAFCG
eukprot:1142261-Pelagomonas_calceolata.AAC.4